MVESMADGIHMVVVYNHLIGSMYGLSYLHLS